MFSEFKISERIRKYSKGEKSKPFNDLHGATPTVAICVMVLLGRCLMNWTNWPPLALAALSSQRVVLTVCSALPPNGYAGPVQLFVVSKHRCAGIMSMGFQFGPDGFMQCRCCMCTSVEFPLGFQCEYLPSELLKTSQNKLCAYWVVHAFIFSIDSTTYCTPFEQLHVKSNALF
jgi:hypothetical protein